VGTGGVGVLNIPAGGGGVLSIPRGRVLGAHWVSSGDTEEEDLATVQQFVQRRLRGDRYGACRRACSHVGARGRSHSSHTAAIAAIQQPGVLCSSFFLICASHSLSRATG
jgi:hypothetical protein